MERDKVAFVGINDICGSCPVRESCLFGAPALDILNLNMDTDDKTIALKYVWNKDCYKALAICPRPEDIKGVIKLLQEPQGQNPKNTA